jgi:hypothetical protein
MKKNKNKVAKKKKICYTYSRRTEPTKEQQNDTCRHCAKLVGDYCGSPENCPLVWKDSTEMYPYDLTDNYPYERGFH